MLSASRSLMSYQPILIVDDAGVSSRILPYVIKEVAGVRIGIFGMMTPDFSLLSNPPGGGVRVDGEITAIARRLVDELRLKACDLIIGLTHIGFAWSSELARKVDGIDIIVDGYDRDSIHETIEDTIIVRMAQVVNTLAFSVLPSGAAVS